MLARLGLFGIRYAVQEVREGRAFTAGQIALALIEASGLRRLQRLMEDHFGARAQALKARSTLSLLRATARSLALRDPGAGSRLSAAVEAAESSSTDLAALRLAQLVASGAIPLTDAERDEVTRLVAGGSPASRLGLAEGADDELRTAAVEAIQRWRLRSANPLTDRSTAEVCDIIVRLYESVYAGIRP